jgi:alpha-1,6-mannosyltransferase
MKTDNLLTFVHFALVSAFAVWCPYTKVEESFNIQAAHDFIHYRWNISKFDHLEFPGVVPRTSIGAFLLSLPVTLISEAKQAVFGQAFEDKLHEQVLLRMLLGLAVVLALRDLRRAVSSAFGNDVGFFTFLFTITQFHGLFYASRTLPNIFAFVLVSKSFSYLIASHDAKFIKDVNNIWLKFIAWFVTAGIVFRSELIILYGPIVLMEVFVLKRFTFARTVIKSVKVAVIALVTTVLFDSWFWERWLYPEAELLYFNVILNKSSEWGVSPWHYYFTRHLTALLLFAYPLGLWQIFIDVKSQRSYAYLWAPTILFVSLYSFLRHKEWRFIFYIVPLWNILAALTMSQVYRNRHKSFLKHIPLKFFISVMFMFSFAFVICWTHISSMNYPGGSAITRFHEIVKDQNVHVHIDTYSAMTGVTRFTENRKDRLFYVTEKSIWNYSKNETLVKAEDFTTFTHLITSTPSLHSRNFEIIDKIQTFSGVEVEKSPLKWSLGFYQIGPLKVKTEQAIFLMANKNKR